MTFLIIDELSMISRDLCAGTNSRLRKIFMMISEKAFVGLSVMTVVNLLEIPPVGEKNCFQSFKIRIV